MIFSKKTGRQFQEVLFQAHHLDDEICSISIGLLEGLDTEIILRLIQSYQLNGTKNNVSFHFTFMPAYQIPFNINSDFYDIAITLEDRFNLTNIERFSLNTMPIGKYSLRLFYSRNHPVNRLGRPPAFDDFRKDTFLIPMFVSAQMPDNLSNLNNTAVEYYRSVLGFKPNVSFLSSLSSIQPNVESGEGVSILADKCSFMDSPFILSVPIEDESRDILMIWKKKSKKHILDFIDCCSKALPLQTESLQNKEQFT